MFSGGAPEKSSPEVVDAWTHPFRRHPPPLVNRPATPHPSARGTFMRRAIWVLVSAFALACGPASPARHDPPPPTPRSDQADAGRQDPPPDAGVEDAGATGDAGSDA